MKTLRELVFLVCVAVPLLCLMALWLLLCAPGEYREPFQPNERS